MNSRPFLEKIARAYADNEPDALIDYCFITPNKRTGTFLTKYFSDVFAKKGVPALLPEITTISDWVYTFTDAAEASRIEQLFILYNSYSNIIKARATADERALGFDTVDFNKFQYWGDVLLNDFNDVDSYMVDTTQLFKNVENLKEISSNFLTPEQIAVIKDYWNDADVSDEVKEFWRHAVYTSKESDSDRKHTVAGFVKLWQVLQEIYTDFRRRLSEKNLTYAGMAWRNAAERLKKMEATDLPFKRYIFVGFIALSKSERSMMQSLKRLGIADFYWDNSSPAFDIEGNRGGRYLRENMADFKSIYPGISDCKITEWPQTDVVAIPSAFGQAKVVSGMLRKLYPALFDPKINEPENKKKLAKEKKRLVETAIILPDENLVQPLLNSIPEEIPVVNVTMGFSLRNTPVAGLLKNIISLQIRARQIKKEKTFFHDDVFAVLTNPLIRRKYADLADEIVRKINTERLFNIPFALFEAREFSALSPVFTVVENNDTDDVINYLEKLFTFLEDIVAEPSKESEISEDSVESVLWGDSEESEDSDESALSEEQTPACGIDALSPLFIRAYRDAIAEFKRLKDEWLKSNRIELRDTTVFQMIERMVGNTTVPYEGVPLRGLQIMGVLEARNLDFTNMIVLSMNERIFPRKSVQRSLIPPNLRAGYEMSTIEHQEAMFSYYFYRMIARAERLILVYDSRTNGVQSGIMSRYISQMRYQAPKGTIRFISARYPLSAASSPTVTVDKNQNIMDELNKFVSDGPDKRYLSAHSINTYINCPMQFYLTHIERYYEENPISEYMDDSTLGTIIHEVIENMYSDARGSNADLLLDEAKLGQLSNSALIERYVNSSIKKNYLKINADSDAPLKGDAILYSKLMVRTVKRLLQCEREIGPMRFINAEDEINVPLRISDRNTINFTGRIDRVDSAENPDDHTSPIIRLIDYKTGSDTTNADSIEALFDASVGHLRPKAILQLMLYANGYRAKYGFTGPIQPYIYSLRKISIEPLGPVSIDKTPMKNYEDYNAEFLSRLDDVISEMFDPDVPFSAKPENGNCKYCPFVRICNVTPS